MSPRALVSWLGAVSIAVACALPTAARSSSALKGAVALARIDVGVACAYPGQLVRCTESGVFRGSPGRARASYSWTWNLSSSSAEGRLTLTFAKSGSLVLETSGREQATNPPGSLKTAGSWRVASGTGSFARAFGRGSYVCLSIENRNVKPVTRTGSITISGTIS